MLKRADDQGVSALTPNQNPTPLLPLVVRGLTFREGGKSLINNINMDLAPSRITMILGPNGAGKSLLLRLLHGLLEPSAGTVDWGGQGNGDSLRERQAMIFQTPVLLRRSVAANIDFVLKLRGKKNPQRRQELMQQVELADRANQPARTLSGGEQQRLALARAIAHKPDVLFLDEPTASLDPASVLLIENIVKKLQAQGTKIIFVTHDFGQARRLADEIIFLHEGRIVEQSPAQSFFETPKSTEARDYLAGRIIL